MVEAESIEREGLVWKLIVQTLCSQNKLGQQQIPCHVTKVSAQFLQIKWPQFTVQAKNL